MFLHQLAHLVDLIGREKTSSNRLDLSRVTAFQNESAFMPPMLSGGW
jgi:hypothetical protein